MWSQSIAYSSSRNTNLSLSLSLKKEKKEKKVRGPRTPNSKVSITHICYFFLFLFQQKLQCSGYSRKITTI
jgi:hypothetical protein